MPRSEMVAGATLPSGNVARRSPPCFATSPRSCAASTSSARRPAAWGEGISDTPAVSSARRYPKRYPNRSLAILQNAIILFFMHYSSQSAAKPHRQRLKGRPGYCRRIRTAEARSGTRREFEKGGTMSLSSIAQCRCCGSVGQCDPACGDLGQYRQLIDPWLPPRRRGLRGAGDALVVERLFRRRRDRRHLPRRGLRRVR